MFYSNRRSKVFFLFLLKKYQYLMRANRIISLNHFLKTDVNFTYIIKVIGHLDEQKVKCGPIKS